MSLYIQLFLFMLLRTVFNTAYRMVYPFLNVFARGLGIELSALSALVGLRAFLGIGAPLVSSLADQRGRKFGMLAGIALFGTGMAAVALFPSPLTFGIALLSGLIGKYLFDPSMQAYLGDRIAYAQRGLALAITEVGWSLAFLLGIPLMSWLIARFGWQAPFPTLFFAAVLMFLTITLLISDHDPHHHPADHPWAYFGHVLRDPPTLAAISIALWASAANELVNLIFGVWLEDTFQMQILALGAASAVIGLSELSGEGLVALVTDRIGKPRALQLGLIGNVLASLALPWLGRTPGGALTGLFLFYITFEYVMVSHVPLMTEMRPNARATTMAFNLSGHSIGRALGAFLSAWMYMRWGFQTITLIAALFNLFALLALKQVQASKRV
jgi:predicted MFS family arabinose efflux permease